MLGYQKFWFPILFYKKSWSFWGFKLGVHPEFEHSFLTRNVLSDFGSFRSPKRECDSFLKIPRCLVCFLKILAINSFWFQNYRSWSESYFQEVRTRATNLLIFFQRFPSINRGDYFSLNPKPCWSSWLNFYMDFRMCISRFLNPKMLGVWICLWNRGLCFDPVHLARNRFQI